MFSNWLKTVKPANSESAVEELQVEESLQENCLKKSFCKLGKLISKLTYTQMHVFLSIFKFILISVEICRQKRCHRFWESEISSSFPYKVL